jgi:hypothetical protein
MNQKIYIAGVATTLIVVLGILFKLNHLPGAGIILTTGIMLLLLVFLPVALINSYKNEGNVKNRLLYIVTWLTSLFVFTSMIFKIMHWPGAGLLMLISLPFPYIVFLPVFLIVTGRNKNFSIYNTVAVLLLLAGVSVFSTLLALNVSKERINDSLCMSQNYTRLKPALNEALTTSMQTPIDKKIEDLLTIIDEYRIDIFAHEGMTKKEWNDNPGRLAFPESAAIGIPSLMTKEKRPVPDTRLAGSLESLITEAAKTPGQEDLATTALSIFDYDINKESREAWSRQVFIEAPRAWSLIYLDGLENNLMMLKLSL